MAAARHSVLSLEPAEVEALLRAFSDWVWKTDADGGLLTDMPDWRAITGQSPEEVLGDGWVQGVHPDDRDRVFATWQAAVESRSVYDVEYRIAGPGGERWYQARAAPVIDERNEVSQWIGTARDVTARHDAQALQAALEGDLALQRDVLEQVLAQSPVAIAVLWGPEHEYRFFNERYLDLVPSGRVRAGVKVAEALPEARDLFPLLDRVYNGEAASFEELAVPFEGPQSFAGERYYTGTWAPVSHEGQPGGIVVVAAEVTEQVRRREDLAEQVRQERAAAEALQRALLPEDPPELGGYEIALAYMPAGTKVGVGGDWYDVVELGDGRLLLVIGDICGQGIQAAAYMSQMRAAVRAYAVKDPAPAQLLADCAAYAQHLALPDMISAGVGLLDCATGCVEWASAGHPAPLLVPAGAPARFAQQQAGPPLGAGSSFPAVTLDLDPGDALVLYTDGAVEDRSRPLDVGMEALRIAAAGDGAGAICDALAAHVAAAGEAADDVALLVIRRRQS